MQEVRDRFNPDSLPLIAAPAMPGIFPFSLIRAFPVEDSLSDGKTGTAHFKYRGTPPTLHSGLCARQFFLLSQRPFLPVAQ